MGFNLFGIFGKKKGKVAGKDGPDPKKRLGSVEGYYRKPRVAVIRIEKGSLKQDETIWFKGHTTDFKCAVKSLEIDHKAVGEAKKGQSVGIQVKERTRRGDEVFLV